MAIVYVIASYENDEFSDQTYSMLAAASAFNRSIHLLLLQPLNENKLSHLRSLKVIQKIICFTNNCLKTCFAEDIATAIANLASSDAHIIMMSCSIFASNVLARLAALLSIAKFYSVKGVKDKNELQLLSKDNVELTLKVQNWPCLISYYGKNNYKFELQQQSAMYEETNIPKLFHTRIIRSQVSTATFFDLLGAGSIVVAAGAGIKSRANFIKLCDFAGQINAKVVATAVAIELGYADDCYAAGWSDDLQPQLYFGFGVSGAVSHLGALDDSTVIVAVNTDKEAAIFSQARYGLVMDCGAAIDAFNNSFQSRQSFELMLDK